MKAFCFAASLMLFLTVFVLGCGGSEPAIVNSASEGNDTILGSADSILLIADTLSSDLFTDYGVVEVDDIAVSASGITVILDGVKSTVTVFDSTGFLASAGGSGSGPDEFQWPLAVAVAENGTVAVSDFMGGFVRILDPGLEFHEDIEGFIMANPGVMTVLNNGTFVGMRVTFEANDGESFIGHQTALWSGTDSEPSLVYCKEMRPFSLNDFGSSIVAPFPMACNQGGVVYVADVSTERYLLTSYSPDGEVLWSVERPFLRTEKTQEEINFEEDMVTRRMQQSEHQTDYTADPYHFAVSSLALGPMGRLWAERPGTSDTFFDVYDPSDGEYLFSALTLVEYERLEVTPAGIFAVTSGETNSLLRLELASADTAEPGVNQE